MVEHRLIGGPGRPVITPLAWFAAAMWCGATAGEYMVWSVWTGDLGVADARRTAALAAVGVMLAIALGLAVRIRAKTWTPIAVGMVLLATGVGLGAALSGSHGAGWIVRSHEAGDAGARTLTGRIEADPREGRFGPSIRLHVTEGPLAGMRLRVALPQSAPALELGQHVSVGCVVSPLAADEFARSSARSGLHASAKAYRVEGATWRADIAGALYRWRASAVPRLAVVRGDAGALLRGIVLGDRRELSGSKADEDFRVLGLSHVVAVSGSHLAVVCALVLFVGARTRAPRGFVLVLVLLVATGFTVLSGMSLAAVRSCVMLAAGAMAEIGGVRRDGLAGLAASVVAIIAASPWSVFDVGFALSVLAVGGLIIFGGLGVAWTRAALPERARKVAELLGATLVAQATTLPLVAGTFGMVSLAAPIANLCIVPPAEVALCLGLGGAAVGSVVPWVGAILTWLAGRLLELVTRIASLLAALPSAAVSVGTLGPFALAALAGLGAVIWVRWPLPRSRAAGRVGLGAVAALTIVVALGPRGPGSCTVAVLDVGQGDAILLRQGEDSVLVDTGADGTVLRRALARHGVRELDGVVLTHDHDDHIGGLSGLVGVVQVGWVAYSAADPDGFAALKEVVPRLAPRGGVRTLALGTGDRFNVGPAEVRVLWPPPAEGSATEPSTNDTSIVLEVDTGDVEVVLTGDAEEAAQLGMAETGLLHAVEVLKVPHHGSGNGLTPDAAAVWHPSVAVVSVGAGNTFGHPSQAVIATIEALGARVLRTDRCGDVVLTLGRDFVTVQTQRGEPCACATIHRTVSRKRTTTERAVAPHHFPEGHRARGRTSHPQPEAGVPDSRQGGAPARARPPPAEGHGPRSGGRAGP